VADILNLALHKRNSAGRPSAREQPALSELFFAPVLSSPSSYPCRLFSEPRAEFNTQRPEGSRNSSPMANPSPFEGWQ
jgi:hypothetical protein